MNFAELLLPTSINVDLASTGKLDVLEELGRLLSDACPEADKNDIVQALVERERLATTGIGEGVAIPHAKNEMAKQIVCAVGISRTGISFDAVDGQPVHLFFGLLAPQGSTSDHLKALARISKLVRAPSFKQRLLSMRDSEQVYNAIIEEDARN